MRVTATYNSMTDQFDLTIGLLVVGTGGVLDPVDEEALVLL